MGVPISGRRLRDALLATIAILSAGHPCPADDTTAKERVLSEYPKALAALEKRFSHMSGEGVLSLLREDGDGIDPTRRTKLQFSLSGGDGLLTQTRLSFPNPDRPPGGVRANQPQPSVYQSIIAFSENYSFQLLKKTPKSDYVVDMPEHVPKQFQRTLASRTDYALQCVTSAHMHPISSLLAVPEFRIDRVARTPVATDLGRLKIDFTFLKQAIPFRTSRVTSGWFVVSPDDQWVLHDYGYVLTAWNSLESTWVGHVDYKKGPTGEPEPVKCSMRRYGGRFESDPAVAAPQVVPIAGHYFEFTRLSFGDQPAGDFTLTAFGLPEPGQPNP